MSWHRWRTQTTINSAPSNSSDFLPSCRSCNYVQQLINSWSLSKNVLDQYIYMMLRFSAWFTRMLYTSQFLRNQALGYVFSQRTRKGGGGGGIWGVIPSHVSAKTASSSLWQLLWYNRTGWLGVKHQVAYLSCGSSYLVTDDICFVLTQAPVSTHKPTALLTVRGHARILSTMTGPTPTAGVPVDCAVSTQT